MPPLTQANARYGVLSSRLLVYVVREHSAILTSSCTLGVVCDIFKSGSVGDILFSGRPLHRKLSIWLTRFATKLSG